MKQSNNGRDCTLVESLMTTSKMQNEQSSHAEMCYCKTDFAAAPANRPKCNKSIAKFLACNNNSRLKTTVDSMRWFSHRRRTGGRHPKTPPGSYEMGQSAAAARCLQRAHTLRTHPGVSAALSAFSSLMTLTFDLWPPNSNSGEIFLQCT